MLKITPMDSDGTSKFRVEGRLAGEWIAELRRTALLENQGRTILDLGEVSFADLEGVRLLNELRSAGIQFVNCSPFVAAQLGLTRKEGTPC